MSPAAPPRVLRLKALLTSQGWLEPAFVTLDGQGCVIALSAEAPQGATASVEEVDGWALPGFQNAHSHAFQYAMAGLAEHLAPQAPADDFWSWREVMYSLALEVTPDQMEAIAAMAYAEMVRVGFTAVVEFHYLHHGPDGSPYGQRAEMGERLLAAAAKAGLHLTLVPVFYQKGGFGQAASPRQARFLSRTRDDYARLVEATRQVARGRPDVVVGTGIHSLRAVEAADIEAWFASPFQGPVHLHVAEQRREVEDALAHLGCRPVAWLLDHLPLDQRFNLVHALHLDEDEVRRVARSGATVVVCPTTEANLGDGFFSLAAYRAAGGTLAIGTDSHVSLNPLEELRWLDYGQRLRSERRNPLCRAGGDDSGAILVGEAWRGGRLAMGLSPADQLTPGQPFDVVVLDPDHPRLCAMPVARRLAALVFAGDESCLLGTMRRGRWLVRHGLHARRAEILRDYHRALQELSTF